ncbi:MAG TPA: hypothetical protein VFZ68_08025 [Acidimicrobiales bacterium]
MLFPQRLHAGLADGSVTLAFRRWRRPRVKAGGRQRTPVGVLAIDSVEVITPADVTEADARRAGYAGRAELMDELDRYPEGELHRITFHHAGPDPRVALRDDVDLTDDGWRALEDRLARLDRASRHGPWTAEALRLVAENPGIRAGDLAARAGRERAAFKRDVRKLKELGLTESLEVGYRLSSRGAALLSRRRWPASRPRSSA